MTAHLLQILAGDAEQSDAHIVDAIHRERVENGIKHRVIHGLRVVDGDHRVEAQADLPAEGDRLCGKFQSCGQRRRAVFHCADDRVGRERDSEDDILRDRQASQNAPGSGFGAELQREAGVGFRVTGPVGDITQKRFQSKQVSVVADADVERIFRVGAVADLRGGTGVDSRQQIGFFGARTEKSVQRREGRIEIDEDDDVAGGVHSLQVAVLAVEHAVHHIGGIEEAVVVKILAHRGSLIDAGAVGDGEDQRLGLLLQHRVLVRPVEYVAVIADQDPLGIGKPREDLLCARVGESRLLDIYHGKWLPVSGGRAVPVSRGRRVGTRQGHPCPPFWNEEGHRPRNPVRAVGRSRADARSRSRAPARSTGSAAAAHAPS